jgi:hypothetical protein
LPGVCALFDDEEEDEEVDDLLSLLPLLLLGSQVLHSVLLSSTFLAGRLCYFHFLSRPFKSYVLKEGMECLFFHNLLRRYEVEVGSSSSCYYRSLNLCSEILEVSKMFLEHLLPPILESLLR